MNQQLCVLLLILLNLPRYRSPHAPPESAGDMLDLGLLSHVISTRLKGVCIDDHITNPKTQWWHYQWCSEGQVVQVHLEDGVTKEKHTLSVYDGASYISRDPGRNNDELHQHFKEVNEDCVLDAATNRLTHRKADVVIRCCAESSRRVSYIDKVKALTPCNYEIEVCSPHFCFEGEGAITAEDERAYKMKDLVSNIQNFKDLDALERFFDSDTTRPSPTSSAASALASPQPRQSNVRWMDIDEQIEYREKVRAMFTHAYDSYMKYAFPLGELRPLSCTGGPFDLIKINMVTLIDALDTLIVMGNYSEFRIAAHIVTNYIPSFDMDVNVSVFETNIRILGGLLSAHLFAVDEELGVYDGEEEYDFGLLRLAQDIGDRLLPAFDSPTGIPYGTVNLRHGVPPMESEVASTAGAGSLVIELEVLSTLTGDNKYGDAALKAVLALYERRGSLALVGKHININSGRWHETTSGIGSNADSFYEYLFKASQLFRSDSLFTRFSDMFIAVKKQLQIGDWFSELDISNNKYRRSRFESLQAFWPGMEANMGLAESSARLLNTFYAVWVDYGFLPEDTDWSKLYTTDADLSSQYPLRPELIESTYHQYRTTGDKTWLLSGVSFLESIANGTWSECGYAVISDLGKRTLDDNMPSFFLSETLKYLYLLFDEYNFIHKRSYIFSTEAHPFDTVQLHSMMKANYEHFRNFTRDVSDTKSEILMKKLRILPNRCRKRPWHECSLSMYSPFYNDHVEYINKGINKKGNMWQDNIPGFFEGSSGSTARAKKRPRRADACYQNEPDSVKQENPTASVQQKRTLQATVGDLGDFSIDITADKFLIKSKSDGNTLDISSVGRNAVYVNDYGDEKGIFKTPSRTVAGTISGNSISCSVYLLPYGDSEFSIDKLSPLSFEAFKSRDCAMAVFGPTRDISASLVQDDELADQKFSKAVHYSIAFTGETEFSNDEDENGCASAPKPHEVESKEAKSKGWSPLPFLKEGLKFVENLVAKILGKNNVSDSDNLLHRPEGLKSTSKEKTSQQKYTGKVLVMFRGSCLFEEKTEYAQALGATAAVIINSKDSVFLMAGKTEENPAIQKSAVSIPTVMISKADGLDIHIANSHLRSKGISTKLSLHITSTLGLLDSPFMGHFVYPKIRVSKHNIFVHSRGRWSAILSTVTPETNEWQLFILPKKDVPIYAYVWETERIQPGKNSQSISISTSFVQNPIEIYSYALRRKCPDFIVSDKHSIGIKIDRMSRRRNIESRKYRLYRLSELI